MSIRRLAYVSTPRPDLPATEIPRIVGAARVNNERDSLSGVLVYTGTDFAQLIEGDPARVETLWQRIQADPRHRDLNVLLDEVDETRWFPDWRMGYIADPALARQIREWRSMKRAIDARGRSDLRRLLAAADTL